MWTRLHPSGRLYDGAMSATLTDIYDLPQEHKDFRATIRQIVDEKVRPRAAEIDATGEYPWDVRKLFAEQDILALPFDEQYGGTGTGTVMLQIAVEEIAKACASSALILMVQELGTLPIALFGSDELKERLLPKCATGEWSPAFALSEPEAGSDAGVDEDDRGPRRRRVGHQRRQELDHELRHRRLLRRLRDDRPREPAPERLRRRGRSRGVLGGQARAQARHQGLADRLARSSRTCASRRPT